MAGVVTAVFSDKDIAMFLRWADLADARKNGTNSEKFLVDRLDNFARALSCTTCEGPQCATGKCDVPSSTT